MAELGAVAETALWTLHHRAAEASRPDGVIRDPMAIDLVGRIDHPLGARFGDDPRVSQWQALRALTFDREVARFAAVHPGGTVVALGEGLETQFWRVDDGRPCWVTVDVPEILDLRGRLLPPSPWRWGWDAAAEREVAALPGVAELRVLHPPRGRGALLGALLPAMSRVPPPLRRLMLSIHRAGFAGA